MVQKVLGNNNKTITVSSVNNGVADDGNSSSNVLLAGVPFVGVGIEVTDFVEVIVSVFSDVASATDGLSIQYSADNIHWDHADEYSIPAGIGKNFSVQRITGYFRIVYTNGAVDQTEFRLTSILNKVRGKPSSHRLSDDITSEDDAELTTTVIKTVGSDPSTFHNVDVQHPLPNDGDSVYLKDIDVSNSDNGGFSGAVTDYFDSLKSVNFDASVTNPKVIKVWLNRTVQMHELGIGCDDITKSFSNIKFKALGSGEEVRFTKDLSADNTKLNSFLLELPHLVLNGFIIEFHTVDEIGLSNLWVQKAIDTRSSLLAVKPDGVVTAIDATQGGNLKISLEEFETTFYENPLPVTDMNLLIARGLRVGITKINKYGQAKDGIQITSTDVWDRADSIATQQIWLAPTAARIHTIISTSTADDGTPEGAGAGAQAIRIWYLPDWDTKETFEDVILNGVAGVVMINSAVIIHRMKIIPVGTTYATNVGIITATAATDGTVTAQINAGNGQTEMAIYGIPSVQTGYMPGYDLNAHNTGNPSNPTQTDFTMLVNERPDLNTLAFINKSNKGTLATGTTDIKKEYRPYNTIPGPAIIKFQAVATVADTEATAEFDLILVDN